MCATVEVAPSAMCSRMQRERGVGIAPLERDGDALVLLEGHLRAAREPDRAPGQGLPQARDELLEVARRGGVVDRAVPQHVELRRARAVGVGDRDPELRVQPAQLVELVVRHALGGEPRGHGLEDEAQRVDLGGVLGRVLRDGRAPMGVMHHEALGLQHAQRLADRRRAHLQVLDQPLDAQVLAGVVPAVLDRLTEGPERGLGLRHGARVDGHRTADPTPGP